MAGKHWEIEGTKAAGQQAEAQLQQQQEQQQREKQEAELEHLQQLLQRQQLQDQQLQQSVSSGSAQEPQQRSWLTESIPGPGAVGGPLRNGLAPGLLHAHSRGDSFSGELSAASPCKQIKGTGLEQYHCATTMTVKGPSIDSHATSVQQATRGWAGTTGTASLMAWANLVRRRAPQRGFSPASFLAWACLSAAAAAAWGTCGGHPPSSRHPPQSGGRPSIWMQTRCQIRSR